MRFNNFLKEDRKAFDKVIDAKKVLLDPQSHPKLTVKHAAQTLGLSDKDAQDPKKIKSAFRKKAMETHPDTENIDRTKKTKTKTKPKTMISHKWKLSQLGAFMGRRI